MLMMEPNEQVVVAVLSHSRGRPEAPPPPPAAAHLVRGAAPHAAGRPASDGVPPDRRSSVVPTVMNRDWPFPSSQKKRGLATPRRYPAISAHPSWSISVWRGQWRARRPGLGFAGLRQGLRPG